MAQLVQDVAQSILAATHSDAGLQLAGRWINERYVELVGRARTRQLSHCGTAYVPAPYSGGCRIVQGSNTVVLTVGSPFEQPVQWLNGLNQIRFGNVWYWVIGGGFDIQRALNLFVDSPISDPTNNNAPFTIVQRLIPLQPDARWISNVMHPRLRKRLKHLDSAQMESQFPSRMRLSNPRYWTEGSRYINDAQGLVPTGNPFFPAQGGITTTGANLTGLSNPISLTIAPYVGTGLSGQSINTTLTGSGLFGVAVTPIIPWSVMVSYLCNDGIIRTLKDNGVSPLGGFSPADLTQAGTSATFPPAPGNSAYTAVTNATINYNTGAIVFPWDANPTYAFLMPALGSPVNFTFSYRTTPGSFTVTNQKLIEIYPLNNQSETLTYTYWSIPPQLALTDSLPPEIDAYILREGVLVDVYRYKTHALLEVGKIQESEIYANKEARQRTIWEQCIQDALVADQAYHNTMSVQLTGGAYTDYHEEDIITARDWASSEAPD